MTDVYASVADNMAAMRKQIEELKTELAIAQQTRDAAQAQSNKDLFAKREAEEQVKKLRHALAFARSVIKSGEPWTQTCEEIIGGALA